MTDTLFLWFVGGLIIGHTIVAPLVVALLLWIRGEL
jgi:hypothetical protein